MKNLVIGFVKAYQKLISPLFPSTCRYYPTCSNYAVQAIEMHGAVKGSTMSIARIIRCNPFVLGGVDKVPDHFTLHRNPDTIDYVYLGDGLTISPEETLKSDELDRTIARLQEVMVIKKIQTDATTQLKQLVDISERSIDQLPEGYLEMNRSALLHKRFYRSQKEMEMQGDFHFYQIIKNAKSDPYFDHVHPSPVHKDYQHGRAIYCFIDQTSGYMDTNSPLLEETFKRTRGISQKDVDEKTAVLLEYLLFLESSKHEEH